MALTGRHATGVFKRSWLLACCLAAWMVAPAQAGSADFTETFYLPVDEQLARSGQDVMPLGMYFAQVENLWKENVSAEHQDEDTALVMVVWPGGATRAWIVGAESLSADARRELIEKITEVEAPPVEKGPVAVALVSGTYQEGRPPIPPEWKEAAQDAKTAADMLDALQPPASP